jgi:hypothetical protein
MTAKFAYEWPTIYAKAVGSAQIAYYNGTFVTYVDKCGHISKFIPCLITCKLCACQILYDIFKSLALPRNATKNQRVPADKSGMRPTLPCHAAERSPSP